MQLTDKDGNIFGTGGLEITTSTGKPKIPVINTDITIGTTSIVGGVAGRLLFDDAGVVGETNGVHWDKVNSRMGFGTTTPAYGISHIGNIGVAAIFSQRDFGFGAYSQITQRASYIAYTTDGTTGLAIGAASGAARIQGFNGLPATSDKPIFLQSLGGNVGIGTTTDAGFKFDVNGTSRIQVSSAGIPNILSISNLQTDAGPGGAIAFYTGGVAGNASRIVAQRSGSVGQSDIALETNGVRRLFVSANDGNVGIGTTTPLDFNLVVQGILQVRNAASSFTGLRIDNSSIRKRDTSTFSLGTNDTTVFNIFAPTNNIGINTTTDAGYTLDVNGTTRIQRTLDLGSVGYAGTINLRRAGDGGITSQITQTNDVTIIHNYQGSGTELKVDNVTYFHVRGFANQYAARVMGNLTAVSGLSTALIVNNAISASANNDTLIGLDIAPTFNNGAFTGLENIHIRSISSANATVVKNILLKNTGTGNGSGVSIGFNNLAANNLSHAFIKSYYVTPSGMAMSFGTGGGSSLTSEGTTALVLNADQTANFTARVIANSGGFQATGTTTNLLMSDNGTPIITRNGSTGIQFLKDAYWQTFSIFTNNTENLRVASTGNVLINTTTDAGYKLDVNGNTRSSRFYATDGITLARISFEGFNNQIGIDYNSTSGLFKFFASGNNFLSAGWNLDTIIAPVRNTVDNIGDVVIQGGGSERVRFKANGNVGIGTTSPTSPLFIYTNTSSTTITGNNALILHNNNPSQTVNNLTELFFSDAGQATGTADGLNLGHRYASISGFVTGWNFLSSAGGLNFVTKATTSSSITTKLQIRPNGNIIIQDGGTFTDAGYKLDVAGTAIIGDSSNYGTVFKVRTPGSGWNFDYQYLSLGTVLKLGLDRLELRVNNNTAYIGNNGDSSNASLTVMSGHDAAATSFAPIIFGSGRNASLTREVMRIDNQNKYVGIGTTNPTTSLDVNGTVKALYVNTPMVYGSGDLDLAAAGGTTGILIKNATRNVLINTTVDSGYKLEVNGTGYFGSNLRVNGTITAATPTANTYICHIGLTTDQVLVSGADAVLDFVDIADTNNWYDPTTKRFLPNVAGYYHVDFSLWFEPSPVSTGQYNIQVRKNGTTVMIIQQPTINNGTGQSLMSSKLVYFNGTTDYIDFTAYQSTGSNRNIWKGTDSSGTYATIHLLAV